MHYAIHIITQMQDSFLSFTKFMYYMINQKFFYRQLK